MIEKLKGIERDYDTYTATELIASNSELFLKINEIIDVLNAIMLDIGDYKVFNSSKKPEPADPYAEQRKWIGKLCKFWDDDEPENCVYGVLCSVFDLHHSNYPFQCGNGIWYECCEPASEDLIYKGE